MTDAKEHALAALHDARGRDTLVRDAQIRDAINAGALQREIAKAAGITRARTRQNFLESRRRTPAETSAHAQQHITHRTGELLMTLDTVAVPGHPP